MSKVFLCGDPHGEFDHILSAIDQWHPDAVSRFQYQNDKAEALSPRQI